MHIHPTRTCLTSTAQASLEVSCSIKITAAALGPPLHTAVIIVSLPHFNRIHNNSLGSAVLAIERWLAGWLAIIRRYCV